MSYSRIVIARVFLVVLVYIAISYLSGTEEPSPWLGILSVKFLKFKVLYFSNKGSRRLLNCETIKYGAN